MDQNGENTVRMLPSASYEGMAQECVSMDSTKLPRFVAQINSRRALKDIKNIVGVPHQSCKVSKQGVPDDSAAGFKSQGGINEHRRLTRKYAATLANQTSDYIMPSAREQSIGSDRQKRLQKKTAGEFHSSAHMENNRPSEDLLLLPVASDMEEEGVVCSEFIEIEMEDIEEETITDIDSADSCNPLAVVEYVDDIYSFYRRTEDLSCVSPNYMSNQSDINERMRGILIDWLIEVHYKLELMDETLFLMVNIIDRFLSRQSVARKKLQLVGVTAMLLACKYEEVTVPIVDDLILICDRAYTRSEVLEMERMIVNTLQFYMSVPTPYVFMRRFLKAATSDKKLELQSFFIMELCLVEYEMLKFRPSLLAAAALFTAQCTLTRSKNWTKCCEVHTKYSEEQLLECSRAMVQFHQRASEGKFTGVHRKYSTTNYCCAANSEPAAFLLDDAGNSD